MFSDCRLGCTNLALVLCYLLAPISIVKGDTTATAESLVNSEQVDAFRSAHHLLEGTELHLQMVSADNTVSVNGKAYDVNINTMEPFHVYTRDATYTHDGIPYFSLPRTNVFQWKTDTEIVTVIQERSSSPGSINASDLLTILITLRETGQTIELANVAPGVLGTITGEDYDIEKMELNYRHGATQSPNKYSHGLAEEIPQTHHDNNGERRSLASNAVCDFENSRVIELAIAYDSSFCRKHGGRTNADAAVAAYVALVSSTKYQQNGLCFRIELSHLEGHCNFQETDPYREMVHLNNVGCGGGVGVLQEFSTFWDNNRSYVRRDVAHLLSGTEMGCDIARSCFVGCAYLATTCSGVDAYAVNHVTFTESYDTIAILLAHELGHNNGAKHYGERGYIMYDAVDNAPKGFSEVSLLQFDLHFLRETCNSDSEEDKGGNEILSVDNSVGMLCGLFQVVKSIVGL